MFSFFNAVVSFLSVVVQIVINGFNFLISFFTGILLYMELCASFLQELPLFITMPASLCLMVILALQLFNKGS